VSGLNLKELDRWILQEPDEPIIRDYDPELEILELKLGIEILEDDGQHEKAEELRRELEQLKEQLKKSDRRTA